jgi:hypothetical protein
MAKYIQSSEHAIIGSSGSPAETVAPGERASTQEDVVEEDKPRSRSRKGRS